MTLRLSGLLGMSGLMVFAVSGYSQTYPTKPIRIITSGIGGGNDFVARLIAQGISAPLGQQVIVENRASGVIPGELVARAQPDGYTLLIYGATLWIGPLIQEASYDPVRAFTPISIVEASPLVVVVNPSLGVNSVKELIALAKAKPGTLNYASTATGSATHLSVELFKALAGVNIVRVPYKGVGAAVTDLLGNQVQVMFVSPPAVSAHVKSGKLKALAVTSPEPSALAPGLPTVSASGLPGFESVTITGLFAPAGTPRAVTNRLHEEVVKYLKTSEARERFLSTGSETVGSSPEALAAAMKSDITRLGKVIKDAGIRAE